MRFRIVLCMALGLVLILSHSARSFGRQEQTQANRSQAQQGQDQGQPANRPQAQQGQAPGQEANRPQAQQGQAQDQQGSSQQSQSGQNPGQQGLNPIHYSGQQGQFNQWNPLQIAVSPNASYIIEVGSRNSGMSLAAADDALRAQLRLPKSEGLIVTAVEPGSPAASVGIEPNDVLLRLGSDAPKGIALGKPEDLEKGLKLVADSPQELLLLRRGRKLAIKVQPQVKVSLGPVHPEPPSFWIGVSVGSIEPALRAQLQLPNKYGLLALEVVKDSPAEKAGIRPHDILLRLDGEALTDQAVLIQIVQSKGEKTVSLEMVREGKHETIEITPERKKNLLAWKTGDESKPAMYSWVQPVLGWSDQINYAPNLIPWTGTAWVNPQEPRRDGDPATVKRLDDLTAQVKELRQAIDALTKAAQERPPQQWTNRNNPPQGANPNQPQGGNPNQSQGGNPNQSQGGNPNQPQGANRDHNSSNQPQGANKNKSQQ